MSDKDTMTDEDSMSERPSAEEAIRKSEPGLLLSLLEIPGANPRDWGPDEIADMVRHQLAAALEEDLGTPLARLDRALEGTAHFHGLRSLSFEGLLLDPSPPLEALKLVKEFAKAQRSAAEPLLPPEVAAVLYFGSIAAAGLRHGQRISTMEADRLREGIGWLLGQPWCGGPIRKLFEEAAEVLGPGPSAGPGPAPGLGPGPGAAPGPAPGPDPDPPAAGTLEP